MQYKGEEVPEDILQMVRDSEATRLTQGISDEEAFAFRKGYISGRLGHTATNATDTHPSEASVLLPEREQEPTVGDSGSSLPTREDIKALNQFLLGDFPTNPPGIWRSRY